MMKIYIILSLNFGSVKTGYTKYIHFLQGRKIHVFLGTLENLKDEREYLLHCRTVCPLGEGPVYLFMRSVIQLTYCQQFSETGLHGS